MIRWSRKLPKTTCHPMYGSSLLLGSLMPSIMTCLFSLIDVLPFYPKKVEEE
ncbi:hypothetical protein Lalb_Chr02g0142581 [Lupinus albus]|uniref:Uncharacterized protein n=1 Tax=Lupinus albus TaxID=3870 RepID=A0A6A4QWB5_LUPAL|nr:hypothetical protein Lalb_Chr02g0142581 [Lupinus albus]